MLKIKDVELKSRVIAAPMAGVSNKVFRKILREYMDGLICCEMISDKALNYENSKTLEMIQIDEQEESISLQVFGGEVDSIVQAAKFIDENSNCLFIDINMGCPVRKVLKSGAGSQLLKDPDKVKLIVSEVVKAVKKPVTVKIRMGFDFDSINYLEIGKIIEEAGASAIVLHGRTRSQFYEGQADWQCIKELKEHVNIPVIGNGDIKSVDDAIKMIEMTNCDGIMIGRGLLGNPWLAQEIEYYLKTGERLKPISNQEKIAQCLQHLNLLIQEYGPKLATVQMRSHAAWYLKGMKNNGVVKQKLNMAQSPEEMSSILNEYLDELSKK